jgi:hypothetical protein
MTKGKMLGRMALMLESLEEILQEGLSVLEAADNKGDLATEFESFSCCLT